MKKLYHQHPILFHLSAVLVLLTIFIVGGIIFLKSYTQHGQTITVPDLSGKKVNEVERILNNRDLQFQVIDSSYSDKVMPLTVIDQNPKPGSKVKEERTVYITLNSLTPPKVKMPDLKDASLKQAQLELESIGLKLGRITYKPDLALNAVLDQSVNGKRIEPGTMISKGSRIDLVVGDGLGQTEIDIPNLVGLTVDEAKFVLDGVGLNMGAIVPDNTTSPTDRSSLVYQQMPSPEDPIKTIKQGEPIDVFITLDRSKINLR